MNRSIDFKPGILRQEKYYLIKKTICDSMVANQEKKVRFLVQIPFIHELMGSVNSLASIEDRRLIFPFKDSPYQCTFIM